MVRWGDGFIFSFQNKYDALQSTAGPARVFQAAGQTSISIYLMAPFRTVYSPVGWFKRRQFLTLPAARPDYNIRMEETA